jgi:hypothetical protein
MSAKTAWFYCGHCGFKNHPRVERDERGQPREVDQTKCEQCGAAQDEADSYDYRP